MTDYEKVRALTEKHDEHVRQVLSDAFSAPGADGTASHVRQIVMGTAFMVGRIDVIYALRGVPRDTREALFADDEREAPDVDARWAAVKTRIFGALLSEDAFGISQPMSSAICSLVVQQLHNYAHTVWATAPKGDFTIEGLTLLGSMAVAAGDVSWFASSLGVPQRAVLNTRRKYFALGQKTSVETFPSGKEAVMGRAEVAESLARIEPEFWHDEHWLGEIAPPGQRVRYYPVRGKPEYRDTVVRSEPWQISDKVLIKVDGQTGGVFADHLQLSFTQGQPS